MTRVATVANAMGKRALGAQQLPREGTILRAVYDRLRAADGLPTDVSDLIPGRPPGTTAESLRSHYGCDIRAALGRSRKDAPGVRWSLVGEWVDGVYVDYVAARIARGDERDRVRDIVRIELDRPHGHADSAGAAVETLEWPLMAI